MYLSTELATRNSGQRELSGTSLPPLLSGTQEPLRNGGSDLREYWCLLCRRKWTIAVFTAVTVIVVGVVSFLMIPVYRGTGRISIARESSDSLGMKSAAGDVSGQIPEYTMYLDAQVRVLQSDTLILQVAKNLHWLDQNKQPSNGSGAIPSAAQQEVTMIEQVKRQLRVTRVARTPVIEIQYSNRDPRLAAEFVNGLIRAYVDQSFKTKYDSVVQVSKWLSGQLDGLKAQVEKSQEDLVQYQKTQGILGIDEKQNIVTAKLDELNRELTAAQADRIHKQAVYNNTLAGDPEFLPGSNENLTIQHLKQQKSQINSSYAQATAQMGSAHPKVMELRNQLAQTDSDLKEEIRKAAERAKAAYSIALAREKMLSGALEEQKQQANQLNERTIQYNILKHDLQTNQQLYDSLSQKLKEAGVQAGLKANNVAVVDYARIPIRPSSPNIPLNLALALSAGLVGGGILAVIMDKLDPRLRTPDDFQMATALRPMAVIPAFSGHASNGRARGLLGLSAGADGECRSAVELIVYSRPKSEFAESYRALRTALLLSAAAGRSKVVMVTSALPGEGKTTTAVNCAAVLAQRAARVLLIDADLRAPRVHQALRISPKQPGLSDLLYDSGKITESDAIVQSSEIPSLYILPAGATQEEPGELLSSARMKDLLSRWRNEFDHVIIDTAPVLSATESVILSVEADCVLLTVRSGVTPKDALLRVRNLLTDVGANIIGVVVNAVNVHDPSFGYSAYSYSYHTHNKDEEERH